LFFAYFDHRNISSKTKALLNVKANGCPHFFGRFFSHSFLQALGKEQGPHPPGRDLHAKTQFRQHHRSCFGQAVHPAESTSRLAVFDLGQNRKLHDVLLFEVLRSARKISPKSRCFLANNDRAKTKGEEMSHVPHELAEEFPDQTARLHELKLNNAHFAKLADEYHRLNREIHRIESGVEPASDSRTTDLRKQRMQLKDDIGAMISVS
jgi:hypothetical protein